MKTPGASLKTPGAPNEVRYTSALESAVGSPDAKTFETHDADGDGLLNRDELASLLASGDASSVDGAIELVSKLFDDVDLDRDGRVCLAEYEAFCKKARRTLEADDVVGTFGPTASAPVPPAYATDARLEEMFVAYCVVGAAKTPAKERTNDPGHANKTDQTDHRRAKVPPRAQGRQAHRPGLLAAAGAAVLPLAVRQERAQAGPRGFPEGPRRRRRALGPERYDDSIADAVKSLPIPDKLSAAVIEPTIAPQPPRELPRGLDRDLTARAPASGRSRRRRRRRATPALAPARPRFEPGRRARNPGSACPSRTTTTSSQVRQVRQVQVHVRHVRQVRVHRARAAARGDEREAPKSVTWTPRPMPCSPRSTAATPRRTTET